MKFLIDMNLSPAWVSFFATAGFEAVHWSAVGPGDVSDSDMLQWAAEQERVIITADLDFGAILAASRRLRPSVLLLRSDLLTPGAMGQMVLRTIEEMRDELAEGALISLDAARARIRILPFDA